MRRDVLFLVWTNLLSGLVWAGPSSRGVEAKYMFDAYRMDVDISSAIAKANGEDPAETKPWKIGRDIIAVNEPADYPDGKVNKDKYGFNFHAFIAGTHQGQSTRTFGRTQIADPFKPTTLEVSLYEGRGMSRWDPDIGSLSPESAKNDANKYSFQGFEPDKLLPNLKLAEFHKILEAVGGRVKELTTAHPDLAKDHLPRLIASLDEASVARGFESAPFKIENIKKSLTNLDKQENKNSLKGVGGQVSKSVVEKSYSSLSGTSVFNSQEYQDELQRVGKNLKYDSVSMKKLQANVQKVAGKSFYPKCDALLKKMANGWWNEDNQVRDRGKGGSTKPTGDPEEEPRGQSEKHNAVTAKSQKMTREMNDMLGKCG